MIFWGFWAIAPKFDATFDKCYASIVYIIEILRFKLVKNTMIFFGNQLCAPKLALCTMILPKFPGIEFAIPRQTMEIPRSWSNSRQKGCQTVLQATINICYGSVTHVKPLLFLTFSLLCYRNSCYVIKLKWIWWMNRCLYN